MSYTDEQWKDLLAKAAHDGYEDGKNAAGWWEQDAIGGRATGNVAEVARQVLKGLEDGDPQYLDQLPTLDLSGQWADGPTAEGIAGEYLDDTDDPEEVDELVWNYQEAYDLGAYDGVVEACERLLED